MDIKSFELENLHEVHLMQTDQHKVIMFVAMFIMWGILYSIVNMTCTFKSLSIKNQNDTKNRIVSIIHGAVSFIWAITLYTPTPVFCQPNTYQETLLCMFSLAYSVYDLLACIYYGLADAGLYIHHLSCAVGFGTGFFAGYGAIDGIGGLLIA